MPASIACAHAGVTTGEWGRRCARSSANTARPPASDGVTARRRRPGGARAVEALTGKLGRRLKLLVGKPGLDGHSNGAEQIAVRARDAGMEVVYEGIRLTRHQIVSAALEEGVHVIGLSILSGSHCRWCATSWSACGADGSTTCRSSSAASSPDEDAERAERPGVPASTRRRISSSTHHGRLAGTERPGHEGDGAERRDVEGFAVPRPRQRETDGGPVGRGGHQPGQVARREAGAVLHPPPQGADGFDLVFKGVGVVLEFGLMRRERGVARRAVAIQNGPDPAETQVQRPQRDDIRGAGHGVGVVEAPTGGRSARRNEAVFFVNAQRLG
jgi:methylmalonyl-CoA mutase cobalamin-binding domain/chain